MISLILMIAGAVLVIVGILALVSAIHIAVAWWILMLVGAAVLLLGWYLRTGRGTTVV